MVPNEKRRARVQAVPDRNLVAMLKNRELAGLQMAINQRTPGALAALEETIAQFAGNPGVTFYRLGGQRIFTDDSAQSIHGQLMDLAMGDLLLSDPAYTQSLIVGLGMAPGLSTLLMQQLSMHPQRLFEYQLLGVQMQLAHLLS